MSEVNNTSKTDKTLNTAIFKYIYRLEIVNIMATSELQLPVRLEFAGKSNHFEVFKQQEQISNYFVVGTGKN